MTSLCCLLRLHLAPALRHYTFFDIGTRAPYEDGAANRGGAAAAAEQCLPVNRLLLQLVREYRGDFRFAVSLSGTALDLLQQYRPAAVASFRRLADTGCVEFVALPHHHSLALPFSPAEFADQVNLHRRRIRALFAQTASTCHNTEFLGGTAPARALEAMGFGALWLRDSLRVSGRPTPAGVYVPRGCRSLRLLLCDPEGPDLATLSRPAARWAAPGREGAPVACLVLDYRTLGNPGRGEPLSLDALRALPAAVLRRPDLHFRTPAEAATRHPPVGPLAAPADTVRLQSWLGNDLQHDAARTLYRLEKTIRRSRSRVLRNTWRRLQDSEHFRGMATAAARPPPPASPYEAYITYMNVLADLQARLRAASQPRPSTDTRGGSAASRA
jgi:alpha-amylase